MADPVESVISNDDLLTEILVRLPLLSLVLFKSVCKHWYSVIKQRAANDTFRRKLAPPSGLFFLKNSYSDLPEGSNTFDFVPLDNRIPSTNFTTFAPEVLLQHNKSDDVRILDSCNGLLLCRTTYSRKVYVCNPSITNMFKLIPEPHNNVTFNLNRFTGGLKLAFDPTKSPHYKVVYAELVRRAPGNDAIDGWVQIHTFSSETGNWSLCGRRFPHRSFDLFGRFGVYWDGAIYWSFRATVFKLDIMNEHPLLTALPTPSTLGKRHHKFHLMFESRGCLLLDGNNFGGSRHTIYEKQNLHSEWSVKHMVNLDDIIYPERFSSHDHLVCIVLGEREEDSFLVWQLGTKVVQHKIYPKRIETLGTISDVGLRPGPGPDDNLPRCFQFIPSFANV